MLAELGVDLKSSGAPSYILIGLMDADVERLRAGDPLTVKLRELGLHLVPDEGLALTLVLGEAKPKEAGRLGISESMIRWMRDTTPVSSTFADVGLPGLGKIVTFHGMTDEETATAVRRFQQRLARTMIPDDSVVTAYRLDRASGRVTVERTERPAPTQSQAQAQANLWRVVSIGLAVVFGVIMWLLRHRH
jgi:hypothetical protein